MSSSRPARPHNRMSDIGGSADIPPVHAQAPNPSKALWGASDPILLRVEKLVGELRTSRSRRELIRNLVRAAQAIERCRSDQIITDGEAAMYTEALIKPCISATGS